MSIECNELHKIINRGKRFCFKTDNFRVANNNLPANGFYVMVEEGEVGHGNLRIVRVGINNNGGLLTRLNRHINGSIRNSIFRKHLYRIDKVGTEEEASKHIRNMISFYVINDPDDRRKELERKLIGTVSNCKDCGASENWLGLESITQRIKDSGLWNVHYVFGDRRVDEKDLSYIEKNLIKQ